MAGAAITIRPSPSTQTWFAVSSSDLKPSATATSTIPAKTRKRRSCSPWATGIARTGVSRWPGGVFMRCGSLAPGSPVAVFQTDHIVDLRGRNLVDVGVLDGRQAVSRARGQVHRVALAHAVRLQIAVLGADLGVDASPDHEEALVLALVVLERERLALPHMQDLADVAVGHRPSHLVAPRLLDQRLLRPLDGGELSHVLRPLSPARPQPRSRRAWLRPRPRRLPPSRCGSEARCHSCGTEPSFHHRGRT